MNFLKKRLYLPALTGFLFCFVSCCTLDNNININDSDNQEQKILEKTSENVVHITVTGTISVYENVLHIKFWDENIGIVGSGVVLPSPEGITYVLTAGHVCDFTSPKQIMGHLPFYDEKKHEIGYKRKFVISDINDNKYNAVQIAIDTKNDLCVLASKKIDKEGISISEKETKIGDKVWGFGYPMGIFNKGYSPIFFGYFVGHIELFERIVNSFSFAGTRGISGGPVINQKGEIIGITHSVMGNFEHLVLSARIKEIKDIIEGANIIFKINKENIIAELYLLE